MEYETLAAPDYAVIAGVLAVFSIVGVYFRFTGGRQKTTHEFLRADGEIGVKTVVISILPNLIGSITLLTVTADLYMHGTQYWTFIIGYFAGAIFTTYAILPVFYDLKIFVVHEYLEKRFCRRVRFIVSMLYILQLVAHMAVSLYGPAQALYVVTGLPIWTSVLSLTGVCMFYSLMGGLKAILWTNILQAMIMFFCVVSVFVKGTTDSGGISKVIEIAKQEGHFQLLNFNIGLTERNTFWSGLTQGFCFGIFLFGFHQVQVQRFISVKSLKIMKRASLYCAVLSVLGFMLTYSIGTVMYSLLHDCDPLLKGILSSQDQLVPYTIMVLFNGIPAVRGLCVSGIFSSMLSIISSMLNSLASVTLENYFKLYCFGDKLTGKWNALVAKIFVFAYGCLNVFMIFIASKFASIFEAFNVFNGIACSPVISVFLLGLFTSSANEKGTLFGVALSIVVISWMGLGKMFSRITYPTLPRSTDGCFSNATGLDFFLEQNVTDSVRFVVLNNTSGAVEQNEKYIFPLYRVSSVWMLFLGVAVCLIVGYISSYVVAFFCDEEKCVDQSLNRPVARSCASFGINKHSSSKEREESDNQFGHFPEVSIRGNNCDVTTKL